MIDIVYAKQLKGSGLKEKDIMKLLSMDNEYNGIGD